MRDRQRFFEGFASASTLLGIASLKIVGILIWVFIGAIALATIGWIYTELELCNLWREVVKDPRKMNSIPWLMIACLLALILAAILG